MPDTKNKTTQLVIRFQRLFQTKLQTCYIYYTYIIFTINNNKKCISRHGNISADTN